MVVVVDLIAASSAVVFAGLFVAALVECLVSAVFAEDSVEIAADFMIECGQVLTDLTPAGVNAIFERFRTILHDGKIERRVQYTIEKLF